MTAAPFLVWFRNDLRVADNPAFHAAAKTGAPLVNHEHIRMVSFTGGVGGGSKAAAEAEKIRVETEGEDGETRVELDPRSYAAKSVPQRMLIISAGVIMNVIFALIAFPLAFSIGVPFDAPVIGSVTAGGPAWEAGLQPGDRVKSIDGADVYSFADIRPRDQEITTMTIDKPLT